MSDVVSPASAAPEPLPPPHYTERQRAALPGSSYDRVVALLKIGLPALSTVLFLLLVILPLAAGDEASFLLQKDRIDRSEDRLRVESAVYRGEDKRSRAFTVRAEEAVQRSASDPTVLLNTIRAQLATDDGAAIATAPSGRYNLDTGQLIVRSPVDFRSANGYRLSSGAVIIDLFDRTLRSDSPVTGSMPLGSFSARRIRADIGGRDLVLEGGARLRITQRTNKYKP